MAIAVKTCRVCGKSYEACRTVSREIGVFRWQEVACSPECGAVYLQKINESRGIVKPSAAAVQEKTAKRSGKKSEPQVVSTPADISVGELPTEFE